MTEKIDTALVTDMAKEMRRVSDALYNLSVDFDKLVRVEREKEPMDCRLVEAIRTITEQREKRERGKQ